MIVFLNKEIIDSEGRNIWLKAWKEEFLRLSMNYIINTVGSRLWPDHELLLSTNKPFNKPKILLSFSVYFKPVYD